MRERKSCLHARVGQATGIKSKGSSVGELVSNKLTGRMLLSNQTYQVTLLLFGSWVQSISGVLQLPQLIWGWLLLFRKRHNETSHRFLSERPAPSRFSASLPAKQWPLPSARWWQFFVLLFCFRFAKNFLFGCCGKFCWWRQKKTRGTVSK